MQMRSARRPAATNPEAAAPPGPAFPVGTTRRLLDVVVSALLLVLASPVLLVVAVLIAVDDGLPVLYRQVRVGERGDTFRLLKLRSMRTEQEGAAVTAEGDPRITRVGKVLRRTALDELPQLWHVLCGQMTLVGPRPESLALAQRYAPAHRRVLAARPGLTGPAQLRFRERSAVPPSGADAVGVEEWYLRVLVPQRVRADLEYLEHPTLRATLRWLAVTGLFVVGLVDVQEPPTPAGAAGPSAAGPSAGGPSAGGRGTVRGAVPAQRTPEG